MQVTTLAGNRAAGSNDSADALGGPWGTAGLRFGSIVNDDRAMSTGGAGSKTGRGTVDLRGYGLPGKINEGMDKRENK